MALLTCASPLSASPIWATAAPPGPDSSRQRSSRSISGASTRASAGRSISRSRRATASSTSGLAGVLAMAGWGSAPRGHGRAGSSSSSGAIAAGRSATAAASDGDAGLAPTKFPVTGRSAVTVSRCPARCSMTWSPSSRRLAPWAITTSSGSVSEYSVSAVSTRETSSPSTGVRLPGRACRAIRARISASSASGWSMP